MVPLKHIALHFFLAMVLWISGLLFLYAAVEILTH